MEHDSNVIIKFSPPAYIQRYNAIINIFRSSEYRGKIHKVVDFGCSEFGFFNHLKNTPGIQEIICVDINRQILENNKQKIQPLSADYLHMRDFPLKTYIYEGSVTQSDSNLINSDAVICIELIEHLYSETLNEVPKNIFEFVKPKLAIFTTPNADFNVLFPNMKNFRHYDHKFEWTRREFENWANDIIKRYPDYQVKFEGIAPGPIGTEKYGCCSQMAIFNRHENIHLHNVTGIDNLFKLIAFYEYPWRIDDRPEEVKILHEASYFIRKYQLSNECDDETIPFEYLTRVMNNLNITNESFRNILSNGGYTIIDNESCGTVLILPPLSVISDVTSNSDELFDDWTYPLQPPDIVSDSGNPNIYSPYNLTPDYDLPYIEQNSEIDSESESVEARVPRINFYNDGAENVDLANNNCNHKDGDADGAELYRYVSGNGGFDVILTEKTDIIEP